MSALTVAPDHRTLVRDGKPFFWLADTHDAWYRANGVTQVRAISPKASSYVGSELDLNLTWKITKNFSLGGGCGHFFDGKYAKATGASSDADFAYVQATLQF